MTVKSALVYLFAVLAVVGCTRPPPKAVPSLTNRDFILDATKSEEWRPTEAQVVDAKAALLDYLSARRHSAKYPIEQYSEQMRPGIPAKIENYWFQYLGKASPGDHSKGPPDNKVIFINALCGGPDGTGYKDLSRGLVDVADGGSCYFQAGYSLTQRRIVYFMVNGVA